MHGSVCPYSYFSRCGYFWDPWMSFVTTDELSVRITKITLRIGVSWTHSLPFCFQSIFNWMKCPFYQKDVNQITLKTHNSPKLLCVRQTLMAQMISAISMRGYLPLIWKNSVTCMHGVAFYVKEGLPFAQDLSLEISVGSYLRFGLALQGCHTS